MLLSFVHPPLRLPILAAAFVILASCGGGGGNDGGGASPSAETPTPIAQPAPVNPAPQPTPAPQPQQPTQPAPVPQPQTPAPQPEQPAQPQLPAPQPEPEPLPQTDTPPPAYTTSPEDGNTEPPGNTQTEDNNNPPPDNNGDQPATGQPGNTSPDNTASQIYRTAEFNANWGLGAINADAAYRRGYFGQGVTVAVIDTGGRASHRDLSANITGARRFDFDGNTLTAGADEDINGHGTFVAGIVGGVLDGQRFHGVAPSASIMPLRALTDNGGGSYDSDAVPAAFRYAVDNSVHIINNSWGSPLFRDGTARHLSTIAGIIGDNDVAAVWAAGNSGLSRPSPEARAPVWHPQLRGRWLAVVATDGEDNITWFSNYCGEEAKWWCLAAPGAGINSSFNGGDESMMAGDGTSAAAPHVSGALALLKNRLPDMPMSVLVHLLLTTATDLGEPGVDTIYGHGLVNIAGAITVQAEVRIVPPTTPDVDPPTINPTMPTMPDIDPAPTMPTMPDVNPPSPTMPALPSITVRDGVTLTILPPNDSDGINYRNAEFTINWGLGKVSADAAYQRGYWGRGATIAVVDSGVRASHVNLSANILADAARYVDASGNLLTNGALEDPVSVITEITVRPAVVRRGRTTKDPATVTTRITIGGTGTGVADIIAGLRDAADAANPYHGHGIAPSASILPVRFEPGGDSLSAALRYAAEQGAHIINANSRVSHSRTYRAVRHSYAIRTPGATLADSTVFEGPVIPQLLQIPGITIDFYANMTNYANIFRDKDVAVVWGTGDNHQLRWGIPVILDRISINANTNTTATVYGNIETTKPLGEIYRRYHRRGWYEMAIDNATISIFSRGTTLTVNGITATIDAFEFEENSIGGYALAPLYHPELNGRWLAVAATDENNNLAGFSSGCSEKAKHWCLAAPGVNINAANAEGNNGRESRNGTSFAAAHVSGGLALLRSRFPDMPMSVLVHILLTTATDLGSTGVDGIYGHGLMDIGRALGVQYYVSVAMTSAQNPKGLLLRNANAELPSSFAGFAKRLKGIGIAAEYLDGFYYDAPLGGMIRARGETKQPLDFAAGMFGIDETINDDGVFALSQNGALRAAGWQNKVFQLRHNFYGKPSLWQGEGGDITRRPFFADDGGYSDEMLINIGDNFQLFAAKGEEQQAEYSQTGIQWHGGFSSLPKLTIAAAHSNITEDNTLLGGKFGGLMPLTDGGNSRQTDIGGSYALDSRWRLFGNYQRADINAKLGGIVGGMSGVKAEGWRGGFAASNWLQKGDNFRIGIGKETTITGGEVLLNINQASNPQKDQSTQAIHNRGYQTKQQRIGLSQQTPLYLNAGYIFAPADNAQLAIAINARRHSPSALSIEWRRDF